MSQEGLAAEASIDRAYLGSVERGENAASILTLQRIAQALGLRLSSLIRMAKL